MSGKIYKFNKNNVFHGKQKYSHSYSEKSDHLSYGNEKIRSEKKSDSYIPTHTELLKHPPSLDLSTTSFQILYCHFKALEKGLKQELENVFLF